MNLIQWFKDRWERAAVHITYAFIDSSRVEGREMPITTITSGEHYFRLTLAEMFLRNDREWFTNLAPAVYSVVKLRFGDQEETISHVAGPSGLSDLKAASLNRGVTINYPLTPLLPFNGGDVELEAGLVALPGSNEADRLLKVLTNFSKTLAVPQVSVALAFAQPLVEGIKDLVGANETRLVLRLHDTFAMGGTFRPGYLAVIGAPAGTLREADLRVAGDRLHYGPGNARSPLEGYDYALIRVDAFTERDDYHALSAINDPYQDAIAALSDAVMEFDPEKKADKMLEAQRLLGAAKVAAYKAKELTFKVGRRQAIQALQKGFDEAKALLAGGATEQQVARTFSQAMSGAMPAEEAILAGEVTVRDLDVD